MENNYILENDIRNKKLLKAGDIETLYKVNLNYIHYVIQKYRPFIPCYEDLLQSATVGFLLAAKKFNSDSDTVFLSYARTAIVNEIRQLLVHTNKSVNNISLDIEINTENSGGSNMTTSYKDLISEIDKGYRNIEFNDLWQSITTYRNTLVGVKQDIFDLHLKGLAQEQIASKLGTSQTNVSYHLNQVKQSLKVYLQDRGYYINNLFTGVSKKRKDLKKRNPYANRDDVLKLSTGAFKLDSKRTCTLYLLATGYAKEDIISKLAITNIQFNNYKHIFKTLSEQDRNLLINAKITLRKAS